MEKILLTQNKIALVDSRDWLYLSRWNWKANKTRNAFYATRNATVSERKQGNPSAIYMHRIIAGIIDNRKIDHIDGNPLNNQRHNLRICSHQQNRCNSKLNINNVSGFKGVLWCKRESKWISKIMVNYKTFYLGSFHNKEEAALAYNNAAIKYFGEFARVNNF